MDPKPNQQQTSVLSAKREARNRKTTIYENAVLPFRKYVTALAVSPVGDRVVLAGKKGLFILNLDNLYESPKVLKVTKQNIWDITSVKWSTIPNLIASSSHQMISIWDLNDERMTQQSQLQAHRRPVTDMNWSPFQAHLLATCSTDSYVFLWDIRDPKNPLKGKYFRAYSGGATQVKWSKRNSMHLVATHNGEVRIWDIRNETPLETIRAETVDIVSLDTSPQHEALILTATQSNTIKFWSFEKPRECQGLLVTSRSLSKVKFTPFGWGVMALSGGTDPSLELYSLAKTPLVTPSQTRADATQRMSVAGGPLSLMNAVISNYITPPTSLTKDSTENFKFTQCRPIDAFLVHDFGGNNQSISVFDWRILKFDEHMESQLITLSRKDNTLRLHAIDPKWQELCGHKVSAQTRPQPVYISSHKTSESDKDLAKTSTINTTAPSYSNTSVNTNTSVSSVNNGSSVQNDSKTTTILPLESEFRQILDTPIVGIIIEKLNLSQRYLICTAKRGKFLVQVKITFPTLYPRMAPPAFEMLSNISPQSKVMIKEALVQTAQEYVDVNRNCIEACLRKLSVLLEDEEKRSRQSPSSRTISSPTATPPLASSNETVPSSANLSPAPMGTSTISTLSPSPSTDGDYESYIVKPFDTLAAIALTFNMNKEELRQLNKIHHSGQLLPGQVILVKKNKMKSSSADSTTSSSNVATSASNRRDSVTAFVTSMTMQSLRRGSIHTSEYTQNLRNSPSQRLMSRDDSDIYQTGIFGFDQRMKLLAGKRVCSGHSKGTHHHFSENLVATQQFIRKAKVKLLEMDGNPHYIAGVLTVTNIQFVFEPDLDDAAVRQRGVLHYTVSSELNKIVSCNLVNIDNPQIDAEHPGEILFADDDAHTSAILQLCTDEVHRPTGRKIHHFLMTRLQAKELSRYIEQRLAHTREKTLMESLNLDSSIPKLAFRAPSKQSTAMPLSLTLWRTAPRTSKKTNSANKQQQKQHQKGLLSYLRAFKLRPEKKTKIETKKKSSNNFDYQNSIMASFFGVPWDMQEESQEPQPSPAVTIQTAVNTEIKIKATSGREATSTNQAAVQKDNAKKQAETAAETATQETDKDNKESSDDDNSDSSEDEDEIPNPLDKSNLLTRSNLLLLREYFPNRYRSMDWKRIFCTETHGTSLITFYGRVRDKSPTLLLIKDDDGYVFGGYASEPWIPQPHFFGTGECFLFTLKPQFNAYKWTKANNLFMYAQRDGIAMGGGQTGHYGFWIDGEFNCGTSEVSKTFLNRRLSRAEEFKCTVVETWAPVPKKSMN
jgi:WD40 repeat protein